MSSRIFQGIILQLKETTTRLLGVIDNTGLVVACSELGRIGESRSDACDALNITEAMQWFLKGIHTGH